MRSMGGSFLRSCAVFFTLAMIASTSGAASIPSYTITDLGVGTAQLSSASGANATLISPDGTTVYAFPRTDNQVDNPNSLIAKFPALYNPYASAPSTGNPATDLHYYYRDYASGPVLLNANGVATVTEISGIEGHISMAASAVDTLQRQADGTFAATRFGSGVTSPNNYYTGGIVAQALDLNNHDLLLSRTSSSSYGGIGPPTFFLTDLKTGVITNLKDLLPGLTLDGGPALDDQGQILAYGFSQATGWQDHAFLLTPAGLSSNPIPAPEPTTFVTLAVAGLGLAIRRWWKS